jgi:CMP-N-acetylneuraminic acid synthetase
MDNILVIIAARGGSKGVKNKNIRLLGGRPLIAHTIRHAREWGRAHHVVCSTDSPAIARIARRCGAEVPFMRPLHLARDITPKLDALRHAVRNTERTTGEQFSVIVDLDATAPIRSVSDIEGSYQRLLEKRADCVFSVTPARKNPYFNMIEVRPNGFAALVKRMRAHVTRRQDAPRVYDMNASIYVYRREFLLNPATKSPVSPRSCAWIMDEISAIDIDGELDFKFIEFLFSKGLVHL